MHRFCPRHVSNKGTKDLEGGGREGGPTHVAIDQDQG